MTTPRPDGSVSSDHRFDFDRGSARRTLLPTTRSRPTMPRDERREETPSVAADAESTRAPRPGADAESRTAPSAADALAQTETPDAGTDTGVVAVDVPTYDITCGAGRTAC